MTIGHFIRVGCLMTVEHFKFIDHFMLVCLFIGRLARPEMHSYPKLYATKG